MSERSSVDNGITELSVAADQVRADGEAFLITMRPRTYPNENVDSGVSLNVIPPELVALNQPCPTCDGHGSGYAMQRGWGRAKQSACPDCGGSGRLVFDLKTPHVEYEPHRYNERSARAALSRARKRGQDNLTMVEMDGHWYLGVTGTVTHRVWLDPEWGIRQTDDGGYVARAVIFGGQP